MTNAPFDGCMSRVLLSVRPSPRRLRPFREDTFTVPPRSTTFQSWSPREGETRERASGGGAAVRLLEDEPCPRSLHHPVALARWEDAAPIAPGSPPRRAYLRLPTEAECGEGRRGGWKRSVIMGGSPRPQHGDLPHRSEPEVASRDHSLWSATRKMATASTTCGQRLGVVPDWYDPNYYAVPPTENPAGPPEGQASGSSAAAAVLWPT